MRRSGFISPPQSVAGLRGIGGGEQAPARVAALGAADRLQPHRANGVHGGRPTLSDFLSKRNEVRTHTSDMEGKRVSWVELYLDLDLRAGGRPARAPDRRGAGDAHRVDRARAVHDDLVDLDRLRRALQPPRRRQAAPAPAVPRRERARGRGGGRDRAGVDRRQHGLRAQPRGRPAGAGRGATATAAAGTSCCASGSRAPTWSRRVLFVVSIAVPEPLRYVLWAIAHRASSRARCCARTARRRAGRAASATSRRSKPADPAEALDAHHFAERFGLFLIILLGEVVVEAGQASVDGHVATPAAGRR